MRKAALLYNPASGAGKRRRGELDAALALLKRSGVEAEFDLTRSSADTADQARQAVASGCDTIFACGGDGTIHDAVQGIAGTDAALGILPLGTANALAHDLQLPLRPLAAAQVALQAVPLRVALGKISYQNFEGASASSYFAVAAGIGVDAHLFYKLNPSVKHRLGMAAYYAKAWQLWMTHQMVRFAATWNDSSGVAQSASLTELLAIRITNFGGVLRELAPGASLRRNDLCMLMCSTASRAAYLNYVTRAVLGLPRNVRGVEVAHSSEVTCNYENAQNDRDQRVFVEADGELLGTLPATISAVPNALTLLVPPEFASRDGIERV